MITAARPDRQRDVLDFERADALNGAIRLIGIRHRAGAAAKLAELGLYPEHETILVFDARGPQNQRELAVGAGCEPPSITLMVRKLEAAGLVRRRTAEPDAQAVVVSLTERGQVLIGPLKDAWRELAEESVASFGSASVDELITVLTDLAEHLPGGAGRTRGTVGR